MNVAFPPPLRWQDFEELTVRVARSQFDDPGANANGRSGQTQKGVDVFCRELGRFRRVGIQCKEKKRDTASIRSSLTLEHVEKETKNAEGFKGGLDFFIVATTAARDTHLQADVRMFTEQRLGQGLFPVAVWFWDDYIGYLNSDAKVAAWYSQLLQNLYADELATRQILMVMQTAFARAAFRMPLWAENHEDLRQAIVDTQTAADTGLLRDRESRMPLCRAPAGLAQVSPELSRRASQVMQHITELRIEYDAMTAKGLIQATGSGFCVSNEEVRQRIDLLRRQAVTAMNDLLAGYDMEPVATPLIG
jgi:hypothetical protein